MIPLGMGMAWVGYTVGVWGYCLVRGYDVTFMQLFKPVWPGGKTPAAPAPSSGGPVSQGGNTAPGEQAPSGRLGPGGTVIK